MSGIQMFPKLNCTALYRLDSVIGDFSHVEHFLTREEICEIKSGWVTIVGEDTGGHGINIFLRMFKHYPEFRSQYFGFLATLREDELRKSPRLNSHASGVLLGVTQIINGLDNQLIVEDVASKFAVSHFKRGVRAKNVRVLTNIIVEYLQETGGLSDRASGAFKKMFDKFLEIIEKKQEDLEDQERKERRTKQMKKNIKLMAIALIVLGVEKSVEFLTALLNGTNGKAGQNCVCG
ncbi:globin-like [Eurytemora carolleeae]|uniref:globin-like n=1 Tax=Eurytemora carolleeae TaxID=1294199 RepID=UPI000C766340|nr:globin-like [Eurytemora carolleeae]|eukprot:XP_023321165.1 globin-like [Eurytemora affinis]